MRGARWPFDPLITATGTVFLHVLFLNGGEGPFLLLRMFDIRESGRAVDGGGW